jgi:Macro domain
VREGHGDLWGYASVADVIVITTNGTVKKDGRAVMGRGCALEAAERFSDLPKWLGTRLSTKGNVVQFLATTDRKIPLLATFPVKHQWWQKASLNLIVQSARDLSRAADAMSLEKVVMPRPGCGNGGLEWEDVQPVLSQILDDRFLAVTK